MKKIYLYSGSIVILSVIGVLLFRNHDSKIKSVSEKNEWSVNQQGISVPIDKLNQSPPVTTTATREKISPQKKTAIRTVSAQQKKENIKKAYQKVAETVNKESLLAFAKDYDARVKKYRPIAVEKARKQGWTEEEIANIETYDPVFDEIIAYTDFNVDAAITSSTDKIKPGGSFGSDLDGGGGGTPMEVGVWDGGNVLTTHQEFAGRIEQMDNLSSANTSFHMTHVTGTIMAAGVDANAEGMAPAAHSRNYFKSNDLSEMAKEAAGDNKHGNPTGALIMSNHSYGDATGWYPWNGEDRWKGHWDYHNTAAPFNDAFDLHITDYKSGLYGIQSRDIDQVAFDAPHYAIFRAAGNTRSQPGALPGNQYEYKDENDDWTLVDYDTRPVFRYDTPNDFRETLPNNCSAKNIIIVASVADIPNYVDASSVVHESYSNYGPNDDGRMGVFISSNGQNLYSTNDNANDDYATYSGTSMATPAATGAALLWQEYYGSLHGEFMTAATLKALIANSAREAGTDVGPDYKFGWGLIDSEEAIQTISDASNGDAIIMENTLQEGNEIVIAGTSDGSPIQVTIGWTDPVGKGFVEGLFDYYDYDNNSGQPIESNDLRNLGYNNPTPQIVNRLKPRVANHEGSIFYPYVLDRSNPSAAATTGDNDVDNVQQIYIAAPAPGAFTITISHEGILEGGSQAFGLVATGLSTTTSPNIIATKSFDIYKNQDLTFQNADFAFDPAGGVLGFTVLDGNDYTTDGTTITPDADFVGDMNVPILITQDGLNPTEYYTTVNVEPLNLAPVFTPGADITLDEDSGEQYIVWATAIDDGDADLTQNLHFEITGIDADLYTTEPTITPTGYLVFQSKANFAGIDVVQVTLVDDGKAGDGNVNISAAHDLTITINAINDVPLFFASGDVYILPDQGVQNVTEWAYDIEDGDDEIAQILTFNINTNGNDALFTQLPTIDLITGNLTYDVIDDSIDHTIPITISLQDDGSNADPNVNISADYDFNINVGNSFLVMNEIHPWPAGAGATVTFDASGDDNDDYRQDEFIEFVNLGTSSLDISNWDILVTNTLEYTFPINTILEAGQSVVVFGRTGADPDPGIFNDVIALVSTDVNGDGLSLSNGGDDIEIRDENDITYFTYTYIGQGSATSIARIPDIFGAFTAHPTNETRKNEDNSRSNASPGKRYDGSGFLNDAPSFLYGGNVFARQNSGINSIPRWAKYMNDGDPELQQTLTFNITINSDPDAILVGDPTIDENGMLTFQVADGLIGVADISVTLQDDGSAILPDVNLSASIDFTIEVAASSPVLITEVQVYPTGQDSNIKTFEDSPTINANGVDEDGNPDISPGTGVAQFDADEFVEIVNTSNTIVNIGGWTISDDTQVRHTFPDPTDLNPGQAIVVFGNGSPVPTNVEVPSSPYFDDAIFQIRTDSNPDPGTNTLGFGNSGDVITLQKGDDTIVDQFTYTSDHLERSISFARGPNASDPWDIHPQNAAWTDSNGDPGSISPGRDIYNNSYLTNNSPTFNYGGNVFVFQNAGATQIDNWATNMDDGNLSIDQNLVFSVINNNNGLFDVQPTLDVVTGHLTFTAAVDASGTANVTVTLQDDGASIDPNKNTSTAIDFTITVIADSESKLVINEILPHPAQDDGHINAGGAPPNEAGIGLPEVNPNGLGSYSFRDEFVELVNYGNASLDISGWTISDASQVRHIFEPATILAAGQAIVVFGKGSPEEVPNPGDYGGALVQTTSASTSLGLDNTGDILTVKNEVAVTMETFMYTEKQVYRGFSFTRSSDVTGAFTLHADNPNILNSIDAPANISPGRMEDHSDFTWPNIDPVVANPISDQFEDQLFGTLDIDIANVFSDANLDNINFMVVSATPGVVTAGISGTTLTVTEVLPGTSTITLTADDGNGGTIDDIFNVNVNATGNNIPVVDNAIPDQNFEPGFTSADIDFSTVFSDPDMDVLSYIANSSNTDVATVGISGNTLTITEVGIGQATITLTANDGNGGVADDVFSVTINAAPVVANAIADQELIEGFTTLDIDFNTTFFDTDALTYSISSSDENVVTVADIADGETTLTITEVAPGTSTITLTADDGNNIANAVFDVNVNAAPVVDNVIAAQELIEGFTTHNIDFSATFFDTDALTYSISSSDENVVTVSFIETILTITEIGNGVSTITITADDGNNTVDEVFVVDVNAAPVIDTAIADQELNEGFTTLDIDFSDTFSDTDALTYSISSSDDNVVTVDITEGETTLTITEVNPGTSTITLTADDGNNTVDEVFIVNVNDVPTVANAIADQELNEGFATIDIDISAVFNDGDDLSFSAVSSDEAVVTVDISETTLTITEVGVGSSSITVTADDGNGGTVDDIFVVNVNEVNNPPKIVTAIVDQNLDEGFVSTDIDLSEVFTDEDADVLSFSAVSSEEGVVTVGISGTTLTITEVGAGSSSITVTADDGNGGTIDDIFIVDVKEANNTPKVVTVIADQNLNEGFASTNIDISPVFTDEDGDVLSFSVVSSDEAVVTVSISGTKLTITEVGVGSSSITVTADDGNGGTVDNVFAVDVSTTTAFFETVIEGIQYYPNPANDVLYIDNTGLDIEKAILTNINGTIVGVWQWDNTDDIRTLNLEKYATGSYILQVISKNKKGAIPILIER